MNHLSTSVHYRYVVHCAVRLCPNTEGEPSPDRGCPVQKQKRGVPLISFPIPWILALLSFTSQLYSKANKSGP